MHWALKIYDNTLITFRSFFLCINPQAPDFFDLKLQQQVHARETRFDMKFHDVHYPRYVIKKDQHLRYLRTSIFYGAIATYLKTDNKKVYL